MPDDREPDCPRQRDMIHFACFRHTDRAINHRALVLKRTLLYGLPLVCFSLAACAEVVTLRGGARVEGQILKQDDQCVVVDLGFSVVTVPAAQVLEIGERDARPAVPAGDASELYEVRQLERLATSDAVRKFGPAVVVIRSAGGLGSGFFVNRDGFLITNFHVIKGQKRISVTRFIRDGSVMRREIYEDVNIIATDPFHDLAVLQVEEEKLGSNLVHVVLAPEDGGRMGDPVFVIGNPLGLERTVTKGVLSQTARNFRGQLYLQVDAPVNPGNSGGPLFNDRGQVSGVINMQIPIMQGLNFAIPIRNVKFLLDHLEAYAYDQSNPESGYVYPNPPRRPRRGVVDEEGSGDTYDK